MLLYTKITINVNFGPIGILVYKNMYLISFITIIDSNNLHCRHSLTLSKARIQISYGVNFENLKKRYCKAIRGP